MLPGAQFAKDDGFVHDVLLSDIMATPQNYTPYYVANNSVAHVVYTLPCPVIGQVSYSVITWLHHRTTLHILWLTTVSLMWYTHSLVLLLDRQKC